MLTAQLPENRRRVRGFHPVPLFSRTSLRVSGEVAQVPQKLEQYAVFSGTIIIRGKAVVNSFRPSLSSGREGFG